MLAPPIAHIEAIDRADLNRLLVRWAHRMGPMNRPSYAIDAHHALFQNGEPIAVTSTSEPAREVVGATRLRRDEVVELARLCACRRDLNRAMLRLWRELVLPPMLAVHRRIGAISYQDEALHTGAIYRWDGWIDLGKAGGGGTDARSGRKGRKLRVWGWPRDLTDIVISRAKAEG